MAGSDPSKEKPLFLTTDKLTEEQLHALTQGKEIPEVILNPEHEVGGRLHKRWLTIQEKTDQLKNWEKDTEFKESEGGKASIKRVTEELKSEGGHFEREAHNYYKALDDKKEAIRNSYRVKIDDHPSETENLKAERAKEIAAVEKEQAHLAGYRKNASEKAGHGYLGGGADKVLKSAAEADESAAKAVAKSISKEENKVTMEKISKGKVVTPKEYEQLGFFARNVTAPIKANIAHANKLEMVGRGAASLIGVYPIVVGAKKMGQWVGLVSADKDPATQQEVPADVGTGLAGLGLTAAGTMIVWSALAAGGKGRAIAGLTRG